MKILSRMVFKEFFWIFMLGIVSLTGLFVIVDFFDLVQRYVGEWGAPLPLLLKFMGYKVPMIIYQMSPLALPLSALIALGIFSRHRELVAIRAGGVPVRSVMRPIFIFALLCAGVLFILGEYVAPKSNEKMRLLYKQMRRHRLVNSGEAAGFNPADLFATFSGWHRGARGLYSIGLYEIDQDIIHAFTILDLGQDFKLNRRIDAALAQWTGDEWIGRRVVVRDFPADGSVSTREYPSMTLPVKEAPSDLATLYVGPEEMGFFELNKYINKLESGGSNMRYFRVDLWAKLSYPLAGFILLVLAVPLGLKKQVGSGMSVSIIISLIICITFYEFNAWMISIGHGGLVSPTVSAWSADVLYGLLGVFAYSKST